MKTLKRQLEKRGYNVAVSMDGLEIYDLIENDYIQVEVIENGNVLLSIENETMEVDNNLNSILEGINDFTN